LIGRVEVGEVRAWLTGSGGGVRPVGGLGGWSWCRNMAERWVWGLGKEGSDTWVKDASSLIEKGLYGSLLDGAIQCKGTIGRPKQRRLLDSAIHCKGMI
jgi:hypothetical protein